MEYIIEKNPVVSVVVITYNSSLFVVETLDSIDTQTYKDIELIISDDCSTDMTVDICKNWLGDHSERFVKVVMIEADVNRGVAENCNRGLRNASGEWIKFIAGDDVLYPDAIFNFSSLFDSASIIFGRVRYLIGDVVKDDTIPEIFRVNQARQTELCYSGSSIKAPAMIIKRDLLNRVGGFDVQYKMIEDVPLWIKLSESGVYFEFIDKFIAMYRIHESLSVSSSRQYVNLLFYADFVNLLRGLIIPELVRRRLFWKAIVYKEHIFITDIIVWLGNKNTFATKMLSCFDISKTIGRLRRVFCTVVKFMA